MIVQGHRVGLVGRLQVWDSDSRHPPPDGFALCWGNLTAASCTCVVDIRSIQLFRCIMKAVIIYTPSQISCVQSTVIAPLTICNMELVHGHMPMCVTIAVEKQLSAKNKHSR